MDESKKRIVVGHIEPISFTPPPCNAVGKAIIAASGGSIGESEASARGSVIASGSGQAQGASMG